ncbi:hypothetical protein MBLNU230_g2064t1 [Neophaeotheca triangularis]
MSSSPSGPDVSLISQQMMAASNRPPARRGPSSTWNRLRPAVVDPLDVYGLPSKGETRLHDFKNQESLYQKIVERYMQFCASSGSGDELEKAFTAMSMQPRATTTTTATATRPSQAPSRTALDPSPRPTTSPHQRQQSPTTTHHASEMSHLLMAMRKLREGILASQRRDAFAQRAYMFIIHASILARHWPSYLPALRYLLSEIHTHTPLSQPELQEFVGYQILDLACRQDELVDAFAVRAAFRHRDRRVATVLRCLVHDDWVRFWRTRQAVDGYQRALIEVAEERVRLHALKCLGRSYMSADRAFIERMAGAAWEELVKGGVGWQLQADGKVVIRKPKAK